MSRLDRSEPRSTASSSERRDVVVFGSHAVTAGTTSLGHEQIGAVLRRRGPLKLDDAVRQGLDSGELVVSPAESIPAEAIIAIGVVAARSQGLDSDFIAETDRYVVLGKKRRRPFQARSVLGFNRAIVAHASGGAWRQEVVAPLFLRKRAIVAARAGDEVDFAAVCAVRRVPRGGIVPFSAGPSPVKAAETARDPNWGLQGRAAERSRHTQRMARRAIYLLSAIILGLVLARLPSVDAGQLVTGPTRPVLFGSLGANTLSCCMIFVYQGRRRQSLFSGEVGSGPRGRTFRRNAR